MSYVTVLGPLKLSHNGFIHKCDLHILNLYLPILLPMYCFAIENLVLGETSVIDVAVKNTESTSQTYQLTATSVPSGFLTQRSYPLTVGPNSSKEISLTLTATNVSVA